MIEITYLVDAAKLNEELTESYRVWLSQQACLIGVAAIIQLKS